MDDFVREIPTKSGPIEEIPTGIPMEESQKAILGYFESADSTPGKSPLAGNSVSED